MISLLLTFVMLVAPFAALAAEVQQPEQLNIIKVSYFVPTSSSQCSKACEREYFRCATNKGRGKDMKQCSDEQRACNRHCSSANARSECTKECDREYIRCATKKGHGKDMKQCSDERRVCYRRCS